VRVRVGDRTEHPVGRGLAFKCTLASGPPAAASGSEPKGVYKLRVVDLYRQGADLARPGLQTAEFFLPREKASDSVWNLLEKGSECQVRALGRRHEQYTDLVEVELIPETPAAA